MNYKDTIMTKQQIEDMARKEAMMPHVVAEAQAEISFKAGMEKVIDFIESQICSEGCIMLDMNENQWKAKVKEWGIN
jgi:hypothetical protein